MGGVADIPSPAKRIWQPHTRRQTFDLGASFFRCGRTQTRAWRTVEPVRSDLPANGLPLLAAQGRLCCILRPTRTLRSILVSSVLSETPTETNSPRVIWFVDIEICPGSRPCGTLARCLFCLVVAHDGRAAVRYSFKMLGGGICPLSSDGPWHAAPSALGRHVHACGPARQLCTSASPK
jgi:hypothetical protein